MLIGLVGAPNKGKSTLFSALTMVDVAIADYPFTTIDPNKGVAYMPKECVEKELGVKCDPRNSLCRNGTRFIPINMVDIAGLVPGAHLGKGMGNQFLNDVMSADALIQVVDLSGKTDLNGNPVDNADPAEEVKMVVEEIANWLASIMRRNAKLKNAKSADPVREMLATFRFGEDAIDGAAAACALSFPAAAWSDDSMLKFARELLRLGKPIIVAANKLDAAAPGKLEALRTALKGYEVIGTSAAVELALRKAAKAGTIEYVPGSKSFETRSAASPEQENALKYMKSFISKSGSGVGDLLTKIVLDAMHMIVAYPVEDENKYTDHGGNVLPDAILLRQGSTPLDLAYAIHTELAKRMLYAIDAKKKVRVAKDYALKDNDVIKIVSAAK